ncbi:MAG: tetratricopeptide repeat protein [Deltaproteobacteria bacterium]|nr:tetratricopeptide repeat protein [Deltaproteobacteria bacterium]
MATTVRTVKRCERGLALAATLAFAVSACAPAVSRTDRPRPARGGGGERPPVEIARARPPAPPAPPSAARASEVRADDGPLTAKIDAHTPPARANALRLAEEGRQRLASGDPARAIELLERAVAVDARVPYSYYFLACAHAEMRQPDLARRLLDRAGQKLAHEPYWRSRVEELHGKLLSDAGKTSEADAAYRRSLEAWPGNRVAAEALTGAARRGKETSGGAP